MAHFWFQKSKRFERKSRPLSPSPIHTICVFFFRLKHTLRLSDGGGKQLFWGVIPHNFVGGLVIMVKKNRESKSQVFRETLTSDMQSDDKAFRRPRKLSPHNTLQR